MDDVIICHETVIKCHELHENGIDFAGATFFRLEDQKSLKENAMSRSVGVRFS